VEPTELISRIEKNIPGAVLERTVFGRTRWSCAWIECRHLRAVAAIVAAAGFDQLEDLSAIQMDDAIVLTYFTASSDPAVARSPLIFRCSRKIVANGKEVDFDSVAHIWRMAEPFEIEAQDFMGARFVDETSQPIWRGRRRLPEDWVGFPLRKGYVFPTEFLGIRHARTTEPGLEGTAHA
jgi:NADH:ubiquinone oxidoreductase subunit C